MLQHAENISAILEEHIGKHSSREAMNLFGYATHLNKESIERYMKIESTFSLPIHPKLTHTEAELERRNQKSSCCILQ